MKKLIKYYDSTDQRLAGLQLNTSRAGLFNDMLTKIAVGEGINPVAINKIIKTDSIKEVKFYFTTPGNYNHKIMEVVNLKDKIQEEYEITEVTNEYLKCIYYDDFSVVTNESYTGEILNSSMGMNLVSNQNGKLIISDQSNVAEYTFYDLDSTNFPANATATKVVGMYTKSKIDPLIQAPQVITEINYNDSIEWESITGVWRRCILNLFYHNSMKYIIIGNGNFIYVILGGSIYTTRMSIYCFGVYKKYIESNSYNALMVSKDISLSSNSSNVASIWANNNKQFGCWFNSDALIMTTQVAGQSAGKFNIASTKSNSPSSYTSPFVTHGWNTQLLRGLNSASAFTLLPNASFADTDYAGKSNIPYPNAENKMLLSTVNIVSGTATTELQYTLMGKMPFMFWWGHKFSLAPGGDGGTFNMIDNGKTRRFLTVANNANPTVSIIEFTPTSYDNF